MTDEFLTQLRECQEAICSFAFLHPTAFSEAAAIVDSTHFQDKYLRSLFMVCCDIAEALGSTSATNIVAELRRQGMLEEIGGLELIAKICDKCYPVAHATYFAKELARLSHLIKIHHEASRALLLCEDIKSDPSRILADFEAGTLVTHNTSDIDIIDLADAAKIAIDRQRKALLEGGSIGFSTGFPCLDEAIGSVHRGQLILLSARTYAGKTTMALNMASHFGREGRPVLFCCLEMKDYELAERLLCADAGIMLRQWSRNEFTEEDFAKAEASCEEFKRFPVKLSRSTSETPSSIKAKARIAKAVMGGIDLVVVDHLQRVTPKASNEQRYRQLIETTSAMKNMARELDCVVLLLTQLKTDSDDEPDDSSYSEAKAILQEADVAMMLHRKKDEDRGKLIVNKNRKDQSTFTDLGFDGAYQRFFDPAFPPSDGTWFGDPESVSEAY